MLTYHLSLFRPALREHLLAQVQTSGPPHPQQQQQHQQQRTRALEGVRGGSPDSSHHSHNIDPAIAGSSGMMSNSAGESGGDDNGSDGKKGGKRELSTSKRAAQNRAAQVCEIQFMIVYFRWSFRFSFSLSLAEKLKSLNLGDKATATITAY